MTFEFRLGILTFMGRVASCIRPPMRRPKTSGRKSPNQKVKSQKSKLRPKLYIGISQPLGFHTPNCTWQGPRTTGSRTQQISGVVNPNASSDIQLSNLHTAWAMAVGGGPIQCRLRKSLHFGAWGVIFPASTAYCKVHPIAPARSPDPPPATLNPTPATHGHLT